MNLVCPIDNKDDTIQKVSAVVSSGLSTGIFSGPVGGIVSIGGKSGNVSGYSTLRGSSTSQLAVFLASPQEPAKPHGFGYWWFVLWLIPYGMGIGITYSTYHIFGEYSDTANAIGAICGFLVLLLLLAVQHVFKEDDKLKRYNNEKILWDKAMQKWNRLYYCHKHDIVFDPVKGETCTPPLLKELLYQLKSG